MKKVEKKIIKSKKQHHKLSLEKISKIKNKLFPNKILQERFDNFIPYYLNYGKQFIKTLKSEIDPLDTNFLILSIEKSIERIGPVNMAVKEEFDKESDTFSAIS